MSADGTAFSALEDAVSALVAEKHGPGGWPGQERVAVRGIGVASGASRTR